MNILILTFDNLIFMFDILILMFDDPILMFDDLILMSISFFFGYIMHNIHINSFKIDHRVWNYCNYFVIKLACT